MSKSSKIKRLDYYPLLALFLFWFFGAFSGAMQIKDPALIKLGIVSVPAVVLIVLAVIRVRKLHKEINDTQN